MNGRRAKLIRRHAGSINEYRALKRAHSHHAGAQNPNPIVERRRRPKDSIKPTWPVTADQKRQSRPVIVIKPVRQALQYASADPKVRERIRTSGTLLPKHVLDTGRI